MAANSTQAANAIFVQAKQKATGSDDTASVQQFCEVAVLLLIILAFAVVGIACARRVSSALRLRDLNDEHVEAVGRQLRRKIVGTAAFVFVTFLLRAVFSTMNALANALQIEIFTCSNSCNPACNNVWWVIHFWLEFTPEFQLIVVLISSPLALLVALWGMTDKRTLQLMRSGRGQMVRMHNRSPVAAK